MKALVMPHNGVAPTFGRDVFLAPTCSVIGDVRLGNRVSVWYGVVLRGDVHTITVGDNSNLQDGAIFHGTHGVWPVVIGERVSIAHGAIVHGAVIEDDVLIGIGARVLDGSRIGRLSLVAAGAVVREGVTIPPRSLVTGVPGVVKRQLTDSEVERITGTPPQYAEYARDTRASCLRAEHEDPFWEGRAV
ncbi:MAG: gamma carbonic anhydrase family protein [Planctomycetota bacterium]